MTTTEGNKRRKLNDDNNQQKEEDASIEVEVEVVWLVVTRPIGIKGGKQIYRQEFSNGSYYQGEMQGKKRCGRGIYKTPNGSYYLGDWKDDLLHGQAVKYNARTKVTFEGRYERWVTAGYGVLLQDGDRYDGMWKDDYIAHGRLSYVDGDIYEGQFDQGRPNGKGEYLNSLMNETYTGDVIQWAFNGFGTYRYNTGERYEGEFKNNKKDGNGVFYFADGTTYRGLWAGDVLVRRGEASSSDELVPSFTSRDGYSIPIENTSDDWDTLVTIPGPDGRSCPRKINSYLRS